MSVLSGIGFGGDGATETGYSIGHSLRLRASGTTYLSYTPTGAATNSTKATLSLWVKRGTLGSIQSIASCREGTAGVYRGGAYFNASDQIGIGTTNSSDVTVFSCTTASMFRDPSAHYHVVFFYDSTLATSSERVRIYVNGVQQPLSSPTYPAQNAPCGINSGAILLNLFRMANGTNYLDGYASDVYFIDGQALTPSSFAEYDANGAWVPKAYTGTYGANGFYLPFNNATSLATLTADASGNNNNFTATNVSLTAGPTYDWMEDTPTNNFTTLNSVDANSGTSTSLPTQAGLTFVTNTPSGSGLYNVVGTTEQIPASGKWYFEFRVDSSAYNNTGFMYVSVGGSSATYVEGTYIGPKCHVVGSTGDFTVTTWGNGDTLMCAVDATAGKVWWGRNGTWFTTSGSPDPAAGTGAAHVYTPRAMPISVQGRSGNSAVVQQLSFNFGQRPFTYTSPSGFNSICSNNTPAAAITNPKAHMDVYTYLGNGGGLQVGEIQRNLEPYTVARSVRLRGSVTTAYMTRNPGAAGNRRKWTWSCWVRPAAMSGLQGLFLRYQDRSTNNFANYTGLFFDNGRVLFRHVAASVAVGAKAPTALMTNPDAWYNIVAVFDSSNATASNRMRIWINQVEPTSYHENVTLPLDTDGFINQNTVTHDIGAFVGSSTYALDGYLSQVHFIDGQALDPSYFGQTDGNGYWVPKQYVGTYGTTGFKLTFDDNTSLTTLTSDSSGNGNNWTANNISLTSGVTYDSMLDVPGNSYTVLDPLSTTLVNTTLNSGNLNAVKSAATSTPKILATQPVPNTGKWYWEVKLTAQSGGGNYYSLIGISDDTATASTGSNNRHCYFGTNDVTLQGYRTAVIGGSGANAAYGANYTVGDTIGIAFNRDTSTLTFYKNGVSQGDIANIPSNVKWFPVIIGDGTNNAHTWEANFGQRPFAYTPPTGFTALTENNTPVDPLNMEYPGFVWIKNRSAVQDHTIFDSARGVQKYLSSNTTGAEVTNADTLVQFNKEGFLLGSASAVNTLGSNYVAWTWKLPQTGSANTAGTIASTVYANATAGISALAYTGTSANATVGHGLSSAPRFVIVKNKTTAGQNWLVWHTALLGSEYLLLESTAAKASSASPWNNTAPSSTVVSLGSSASSNQSGATHVMYCFSEVAGFSKFGSYTGNGSADGPFVYCGFTPKYVLIKRVDVAGEHWEIFDLVREGGLNGNETYQLFGNLSNAETVASGVGYRIDHLSNGFKCRGTNAGNNASGGTYVFAAFAGYPFGGSNIAPGTAI